MFGCQSSLDSIQRMMHESRDTRGPLDQLLGTVLSPYWIDQTFCAELKSHTTEGWREELRLFLCSEGSRVGDLSLTTSRFFLKVEDPAAESVEARGIVSDEDLIHLERMRRETVLFRGGAAEAEGSLIYKAATLLAEAISRTTSGRSILSSQWREKRISEDKITRKLGSLKPPNPFSNENAEHVEYRLQDDDRGNILFLAFYRAPEETTVTLATVPDVNNGCTWGFMVRDPVMGGGALPLVRNAILCLVAALRAQNDSEDLI